MDDHKHALKHFCNSKLQDFSDLNLVVNRELSFGGVVTNVEHRVSKNGKGWATFAIEDYDMAFEFRVFGEEYLKFRPYLVKNTFVFVKTFVKEGWTNKDTGKKGDPRIQFNSFMLLHDVVDQFARKLTLQLNVKDLTEKYIDELHHLLTTNTGSQTLSVMAVSYTHLTLPTICSV